MSNNKKVLLLAAAIAVLALLLRLPGLGSFMTVDEENWMVRSADFYHQLLAGNPGGTFMTTHPGALTMVVVGAGEVIQEWRLGIGLTSDNLDQFRVAATLPVVVTSVLLIGLSFLLLWQLFGRIAAVSGGLLLATDPYLLGSTQIAHIDGLQALFMLVSTLAFMLFLKRLRWRHLILAGIAFGFALVGKFVIALWLAPLFLLLLLVRLRPTTLGHWRFVVRVIGFGLGVSVLTAYLLWPALWVKDDLTKSFTRDVNTIVTDEHVPLEVGEEKINPTSFYLRTLLGRTPPHILILVVGAVIVALAELKRRRVSNLGWLLASVIGFLILISFAAKKADRYALPALTLLPVIAGIFIGVVWPLAKRRWSLLSRKAVSMILALGVVLSTFLTPYAIAYNSPLFPGIRPLSQQGWGEGLDAAAAWLNEHPLGDKLIAASWYRSVFATYFDGQAFTLSSRHDHRVSHLVTYRNMGGRALDSIASNVLDELQEQEPVHTILVNGQPYAWIYETNNVGIYNKHVGDLKASIEVGQTVSVTDSLERVMVGFATFSGRANTEDVIVEIRSSPDSAEVLRTATVNAQEIVDNEWHEFSFEPLHFKTPTEIYVGVVSPNSETGNAITVRYSDADLATGHMFLRRTAVAARDDYQEFGKTGDAAIRIP